MKEINTTIAAFHGNNKPDLLRRFLASLADELKQQLGSCHSGSFIPYDLFQVHATIVGMEVELVQDRLYGRWFLKNRHGRKQAINCDRFRSLLKNFFKRTPVFTIRFNGFRKAFCTCDEKAFRKWDCLTGKSEFHSCCRSPYEGSFYAHTPGPAVCTGWPVSSPEHTDRFTHSLYSFRARAEKAGFLDKYHSMTHPFWKDDDCYIKLGEFTKKVEQLPAIVENMREFLHRKEPVFIEIKPEDVHIILYSDTSLSEDSVIEKIPVTDVLDDPRILPGLFRQLKKMKQDESKLASG